MRLSDDLDKAMRDRAEAVGVSYQQYVRDAVASRVDAEQPVEAGSFDQDSLRRAREGLDCGTRGYWAEAPRSWLASPSTWSSTPSPGSSPTGTTTDDVQRLPRLQRGGDARTEAQVHGHWAGTSSFTYDSGYLALAEADGT